MIDSINSDKGKLLVMYFMQKQEATIDDIKADLGLKLLEIYSTLKTLVQEDILQQESGGTYRLVTNITI